MAVRHPSWVLRQELVDTCSIMFESKFLKTVLLAGFIVGGIWLLANRDKLESPTDALTLAQETFGQLTDSVIPPADPATTNPNPNSGYPTPVIPASVVTDSSTNTTTTKPATRLPSQVRPQNAPTTGVIRVASFRLNNRVTQIRSFEPIHMMAEICRQYDVVVLQNIDRNNSTWLKSITDQMNVQGAVATQNRPPLPNGARSDYVSISDRTKRTDRTQTAMIYNRETIQLDQSRWYVVNDPDEVFEHDPMVAWFRAIGPEPQSAFTFSLASVEINQERPDQELLQLGLLMRAIRSDGRGEDDVILVGDFQSDDRGLDAIRHQAGLAWVVSRQPTTVAGDRQFDNIVFSESTTMEFTGRGGVIEFHRQFNLQSADALAVSERLPIWAEFSTYEK